LFVAIIIESAHHVFTLLHLWYYAYDGLGIKAFTVIGDIFEVKKNSSEKILAAFIVTVILIMLSSGWSIEYQSLMKLDLVLPLAFVIGIWQMLIMGLAKITDDHYTKYHKYEGW
jgi:Rhodopsin-like GPCR transmembrane domain